MFALKKRVFLGQPLKKPLWPLLTTPSFYPKLTPFCVHSTATKDHLPGSRNLSSPRTS